MREYLFPILLGYFIGAIPFSFIIAKIKGIDLRKTGSGNVGGTNVLRNAGALYGGIAFFLDIFKGFVVVLIVKDLGINAQLLAGSFAVFGHCFPIYLKFKGGKGVATTLGMFFGVYPLSGAVFFGIWLLVVGVTQYVSLASIIALLSASIFTLLAGKDYWLIFLALSLFSILRHRSNIQRLVNGAERKTDVIDIFLKIRSRKKG
ncbi:glycerol-3-phosphate 1-O-acyltransferase PlsY [Thermosipho atlanticus]|uniref:Glycerol-3-phosphate acyltransferase n=1 Tax=Thermosipho atlanticus DSM 15807 TaxID=1123380 RepID=A0A1M5TAE6_9BACT|nr:glycerol-3-phosphate 1-O-acyltransferase PlsY [Thermosipho atlanticus]SHH47709.1 acyl-phosphate glycerol-3-phosphate acyltransferase [Thermosipho atlanticus DSM 15807]